MSFNYDRIKAKVEAGGNHWTSYSDLFLVLSVVFLLLYAVANIRNGTLGIASKQAVLKAQQDTEELKRQIRIYEGLRDEYLGKQPSPEEVQLYQEVISKLDLLGDQAKAKRAEAERTADEALQRENELNHYQSLVKNLVNAKIVAQAKLKAQGDVIEQKDRVIADQEKTLGDLTLSVKQKEDVIRFNESKIVEIQSELGAQLARLETEARKNSLSKVRLEEDISRLKTESAQSIAALRAENESFADQLEQSRGELIRKSREARSLLDTLSQKEQDFRGTIAELKAGHEALLGRTREEFEKDLRNTQLSAESRLGRERSYRAAVEKQNQAYGDRLANLNRELDDTRKGISAIEGRYQRSLSSLSQSNLELQRTLAEKAGKEQAKKVLVAKIGRGFAEAGIDAQVNPGTGDVTISFGNEYFDKNSAQLKPGMRQVLERIFPVYARSLFSDAEVAGRISALELVGFASPTFSGRFVDPKSLSARDRLAVNYNMDLSYRRAKAIFEHVFDVKKMSFPYQTEMLPLVKVGGRSYLATERIDTRGLAGISDDEFCRRFDCRKSQKVIVKFHLKGEQE